MNECDYFNSFSGERSFNKRNKQKYKFMLGDIVTVNSPLFLTVGTIYGKAEHFNYYVIELPDSETYSIHRHYLTLLERVDD